MAPLPRQVVELLVLAVPATPERGREQVFSGFIDKTVPMSEASVNAALNAMGCKDRHCWHGYSATHVEERDDMLQLCADYLNKLLQGLT